MEFLEYALRAARWLGRLPLSDGVGFATGFMVAPRLLPTNRHGLSDAEVAASSLVQLDHGPDAARLPSECLVLGDPADDDFDFASVAWGWLRLDGRRGKIDLGECITMIQHPGSAHEQVALRENLLVGRDDARGE